MDIDRHLIANQNSRDISCPAKALLRKKRKFRVNPAVGLEAQHNTSLGKKARLAELSALSDLSQLIETIPTLKHIIEVIQKVHYSA